mmetsp:Transcript_10428/g.26229  ORF Transcript_10428/g.26229 Transcript_10428/m.26229 type:complete len:894 (-) Transcript_10428:37-2718(-)
MNNVDAVQRLLKKGADVNATDKNNWTPLHAAVSPGNWAAAEALLQCEDIDASIPNSDGTTVLHYLVRHTVQDEHAQRFDQILTMAIERGASYYAKNKNGEYPLHSACLRGNVKAVQKAIELGLLMDVQTFRGEGPLHYCVMTGKVEVAQHLLKAEADRFLVNTKLQTPMDFAVSTRQQEVLRLLNVPESLSPLLQACKNGDEDLLGVELAKEGTNVNEEDANQMSALLYAACYQRRRMVSTLLEQKDITVNHKNCDGNTVLHFLARTQAKPEDVETLAELVKTITDASPDLLEAKNNRGDTPLHLASLCGKEHTMSVLLAAGAKPSSVNNRMETPAHYAVIAHSFQACMILSEKGGLAVRDIQNLQGHTAGDIAIRTRQMQASLIFKSDKPTDLPLGQDKLSRRVTSLFGKEKGKKKPSKRAKAKPAAADEFVISRPSGFGHKTHVDSEYVWSTGDGDDDDPSKAFRLDCKLGEGAYGSVYKGIHKETDFVVAIKTFKVGNEQEDIKSEIEILRKLKDPNIVQYFGCCTVKDSMWILMDYCSRGAVSDLLKFALPNEREIACLCYGTLKGLIYLHNEGFIHRDMKAANILLNEEGEPKIADFGVSVQLSEAAKANTTIGTPLFMSPEVLEGAEYDSQADIWSLAITAIQMAEGLPPHFKENVMRAMLLISTGPAPKLAEEAKWSADFHNFLGICLQRDPSHRPTAAALLDHPFIKKGAADYHSVIRAWMDKAKAKADAEKAAKEAGKTAPASAAASKKPPVAKTVKEDEDRKKQIQDRRAKRDASRQKRDSGMAATPGKSVLSIFGGSKDKASDELSKSTQEATGNKIASLERENTKLRAEFEAYKTENEKALQQMNVQIAQLLERLSELEAQQKQQTIKGEAGGKAGGGWVI